MPGARYIGRQYWARPQDARPATSPSRSASRKPNSACCARARSGACAFNTLSKLCLRSRLRTGVISSTYDRDESGPARERRLARSLQRGREHVDGTSRATMRRASARPSSRKPIRRSELSARPDSPAKASTRAARVAFLRRMPRRRAHGPLRSRSPLPRCSARRCSRSHRSRRFAHRCARKPNRWELGPPRARSTIRSARSSRAEAGAA